jgi:hypothetical protein
VGDHLADVRRFRKRDHPREPEVEAPNIKHYAEEWKESFPDDVMPEFQK